MIKINKMNKIEKNSQENISIIKIYLKEEQHSS